MDQHRPAAEIKIAQQSLINGAGAGYTDPHHDAIEIGERFQRQPGQIGSVGVAMKRGIDVGAGVRHHLDLPDMELRPLGVDRPGGLAAQIIADDRRRKSLVGHHPILYCVAYIDQAVAGVHGG